MCVCVRVYRDREKERDDDYNQLESLQVSLPVLAAGETPQFLHSAVNPKRNPLGHKNEANCIFPKAN